MIDQNETGEGKLLDHLMGCAVSKYDNRFENFAAKLLAKASPDDERRAMEFLLTSPPWKVRNFGLRLARRVFRKRESLEILVTQCFSIKNYSELRYWYATILYRYPIGLFVRKLRRELIERCDEEYSNTHITALRFSPTCAKRKKKFLVNLLLNDISDKNPT